MPILNPPIFQVDSWNNLCRVFMLPEEYPPGYCFGGGLKVEFTMVDWFYPIPDISQAAISKEEWTEKVGNYEIKAVTLSDLMSDLIPFLRAKSYFRPERKYLVICNFGAAFTFDIGTNV